MWYTSNLENEHASEINKSFAMDKCNFKATCVRSSYYDFIMMYLSVNAVFLEISEISFWKKILNEFYVLVGYFNILYYCAVWHVYKCIWKSNNNFDF